MARSRLLVCIFYGAVAAVALIATWSQNLAYFTQGGGATSFWQFVIDTKANPASRSITADIGLFLLAAAAFMITEARRLGVRFVWLYILLGFLIAISVTFPLFMIARERALARADATPNAATWTGSDVAGLIATAVAVLALVAFILS